MKKKRIFILLIFTLCFGFIIGNISFYKLINLPKEFYVSYEEIENANNDDIFGKMVKLSLKENDITTGQEKSQEGEIVFKLFGLIPIKKTKVKILPEEEVYIGGAPIGLALQTDGVIVISDTIIDLENSIVNKNKIFKNGDIIKEINGKKVKDINDISSILDNIKDNNVNILYTRNNQEKQANLELLKDSEGKYKLGIWVRDDLSGIGTLTFVKKDTNQFAALGHAITNGQNENIVPFTSGEIYSCSLVDIEKGSKNNPGELKCVFAQKNKQGSIDKNTKVGIYGKLDNIENLIDQNRIAKLGGRLSVKPGKAKLISNVSGINEEYDIEIIKANYQSKSNDKSLVIRVTDKRLLELTGGIVQGMSGSPIMQNGKIVGAVTHVFISDSTKGFGVYSDWMLEQLD